MVLFFNVRVVLFASEIIKGRVVKGDDELLGEGVLFVKKGGDVVVVKVSNATKRPTGHNGKTVKRDGNRAVTELIYF